MSLPKSYTAFKKAVGDGSAVTVRRHPHGQPEETTLMVASTQIGWHFMYAGQLEIIPIQNISADRTRIIDGGLGIDFYRMSGTLWWTVSLPGA